MTVKPDTVWKWIIDEARGLKPAEPSWFRQPGCCRVTVTRPAMWQRMAHATGGTTYADSIKPANFLLSAQVVPFGHPDGADPTRFHPLAPFARTGCLGLRWVDQYSGDDVAVGVGDDVPAHKTQLITLGDLIKEYCVRPETKALGPDGQPCRRETIGLLQRRPVRVTDVVYLGKESNRLDDVEHGLIHHVDEVRQTYHDGRFDRWTRDLVPLLRHLTASRLATAVRVSSRTIKGLRNGRQRPSPSVRRAVLRVVYGWCIEQLAHGTVPERTQDAVATFLGSALLAELDRPPPMARKPGPRSRARR